MGGLVTPAALATSNSERMPELPRDRSGIRSFEEGDRQMRRTTTAIIGAGHSGLAMSRELRAMSQSMHQAVRRAGHHAINHARLTIDNRLIG